MSGAKSGSDAISLLKNDHEMVKRLFERFEGADSPPAMQKAIDDAIHALKIHATIEEEIFYPAIREDVGEELMDEAREERHIARVLIAELDALPSSSMLKGDHETLKDCFEIFETSEDSAEKRIVISKAVRELKIHSMSEERQSLLRNSTAKWRSPAREIGHIVPNSPLCILVLSENPRS
jgi:hypothetical protein